MFSRRHYFFVYRVEDGAELDERCPVGGITHYGSDEVKIIGDVYDLANARFPRRPNELIVVIEVRNKDDIRNAKIMEGSWINEMIEFEELMTA